MSSTTTTYDTPRPETSRRSRARRPTVLARAVRAEWTKLTSVRSTYGCLLATVVATAGLAALLAWAVAADSVEGRTAVTAFALSNVAVGFGQFGLLTLAALAMTSEFASGSIRTTLAATPARWAVVVAKAVVIGVPVFVGGFVATCLGTLAAAPILSGGTSGADDLGDLLAGSLRSATALGLTGLLVLGLGTVLRSTAGTIVTAVALSFAPPIIGSMVSNRIVASVLDHLPGGLAGALSEGAREPYAPVVAALLLGAWAAALLVLGTFTLSRRDT